MGISSSFVQMVLDLKENILKLKSKSTIGAPGAGEGLI